MIKILKKIFIFIFIVLLLAQLPFIYRRYQFGQLQQKIEAQNAGRISSSDEICRDLKGAIHVHSSLGGHSTGQFDELVTAAKENQLDFVVMTEHPSENFDTSAATLKGEQSGVLFVNGNELSTASDDRFLLVPGSEKAFAEGRVQTPDLLRAEKAQGKLAFITYPDRFHSWQSDYDGIEIFNLHTNAKRMNPVMFGLDAFWSFGVAPEMVMASYFQRPAQELRMFDELTQQRQLTLFAGSDAHSNIGAGLGTETGDRLFGLKFDPYASVFKLVRTHILLKAAEPLNQENLLRALKNGNAYIGFDILGDTTGFSFTAETSSDKKIMGESIPGEGSMPQDVTLKIKVPLKSNILIIRNGESINATAGQNEISYPVKEKGVYRVEVYLDALGSPFDKTPWIISNPIYIR
jgi:hypothetical protein